VLPHDRRNPGASDLLIEEWAPNEEEIARVFVDFMRWQGDRQTAPN